jgi:hypothetical protein
MSKPVHTLLAIFTREASRVWTSCDQKRLKYSVNGGGVRCADYFDPGEGTYNERLKIWLQR